MKHVVLAAIAVVVSWLSPSDARAYLDAGTGSMLVQLLAGGVAGLLVLLKVYWRRLMLLLGWCGAEQAAQPGPNRGDERR